MNEQKWVLVVDDSRDHAFTLTALLSNLKCVAHVASSGREALALKDVTKFSTVLIDLIMPDIDGYALAAELRRRGLR